VCLEMKKILIVAFHYPPYRGSSGIQRTLKFSRFLPQHGWLPIILTASPRAYPQVGDDQIDDLPEGVPVKRAFALDAARHLSLGGSYCKFLALPDRWVTWWFGAVPIGLHLIRKYRPDVILSTHPIATAHLIGLTLHRLTNIPWVADFRDSMIDDYDPRDALIRRSYRWIEKQVVKYSSRLVFTTQSAREMYLNRYPGLPRRRCLLIHNGYDEEDFRGLILSDAGKKPDGRPIRLLHAGLIYPDDRNPKPFLKALSRLKGEGRVSRRSLSVDLRASGAESYYSAMIRELGIDDLVHLLPSLPYRQALQDCADSDGLLLFQAASCNHLIPAKVYEYLRVQKPILALTHDGADTAALLKETGGATIVDLADEEAIYAALPRFLTSVRSGDHLLPDPERIKCYTRRNQALQLISCLYELIDRKAAS